MTVWWPARLPARSRPPRQSLQVAAGAPPPGPIQAVATCAVGGERCRDAPVLTEDDVLTSSPKLANCHTLELRYQPIVVYQSSSGTTGMVIRWKLLLALDCTPLCQIAGFMVDLFRTSMPAGRSIRFLGEGIHLHKTWAHHQPKMIILGRKTISLAGPFYGSCQHDFQRNRS